MKDFNGKIAFITGGASGAGFGQAQVFSEAGCRVVIADIRRDHLDEAMAYFRDKGADAHAIELDITDRRAYAEAADEVEKVYGSPPQLLIQTAGVNAFGPAEASTFEDFDWVMGVCLGGVINGMVTFVPRMIRAGKGGHIAATSSMGAFMGIPTTAPYSTAKAGLNMLMDCYYLALRPYGIGVTVLCPANIRSNIYEAYKTRPAHLKNSGYNETPDTFGLLKDIHAVGMEPRELAGWLKRGIENEQFYVIPYENGEQMLRTHMERYVNYASPGGMKRIEADERREAERMKEMARDNPDMLRNNDVGFAKAKADIDWVDPSKKA